MNKKQKLFTTRFGFITLLTILIALKSIFAYYFEFNLGIADPFQHLIAVLSPFATTIFLLSIGLYINREKIAYTVTLVLYFIETLILYSNIIYYRQFTDFLSFNTIISAGKVSKGLGSSTFNLMQFHDIFYWLDLVIIIVLLVRGIIKLDTRPIKRITAFATTIFAVFLFTFNLTLAESNRPQLLGRTFDRSYIVKYLGINSFLVYDTVKTAQNDAVRSNTDGTDITPVLDYVNNNYAAPNPDYYGVADKKNIIVIHLESFQQFLIDYKINGQEVTPFINSLYHSNDTLAFKNFFHQVGQGKTSDAETMMENSLYGLPEGSVFTKLGPDNTFQAAPAILNQQKGYDSAVFHGNVASFWSRNSVYKNFGYHYFFDQSYYDTSIADSSTQYGVKDKLMLSQSVKYLEQLQQPFYTKFITVTNHYPFPLDDEDNDGFVRPQTDNQVVNNYFATAHYLDNSIREFFDYLKKSGIYDNSMIVLYGDHYGLSDSDNKSLAPLLDKDPKTWNDNDNAQLQRVPFMINMPGLKGGIQNQYGGEIDALPTILHLAGVDTKGYVQFGTDLLSSQHNANVVFRNKNFINKDYTVIHNKNGQEDIYDNKTGLLIENPSKEILKKVKNIQEDRNTSLSLSDKVNNTNLLRFYTPTGFTPVDPTQYNYFDQIQQLEKMRESLGNKSTSVFSENNNRSTTTNYDTDAAELYGRNSIDNLNILTNKKD
ncbi:alkaline phosphatase [Companilactobacillus sp. RD055328]|uniref:LTA synthase family protein n=1 Tax=Companilactobacillus sp. RD055328 TaxID=2916634 RepID=UPI001FC81276|nr:LTA synthase family protein [Companilactobacillus sp. RD055328]GKQ42975.1 alkaline phosphatase [Companilactobacillus sp. RD055328]